MYKLAQLKEAEVRGVVAALVDNGVLQVSSPAQFEKVASDTADLIGGYDYDISDVAQAAQYSLEKTASADEVTYALGELALQKLAGDIDDDAFDYYAASLVKQATDNLPALIPGVSDKVRQNMDIIDDLKVARKSNNPRIKNQVAAVDAIKNMRRLKQIGGGVAAAALLGGGAYGAKKLYDSRKKK